MFQMFQRLCIHVIQRLRPVHAHLYLQPGMEDGCVMRPFCLPLKPDNHPLVSKHICCYPVNETGTFFPKRSHVCWSVCRSDDMDGPVEDIGSRSCVTRFVKTLLSIMEHGVKPHSKHLTEYFAFLYEFAKMGEEEVTTTYLFNYFSIYLRIYLFVLLYLPNI